ncbi:MAG TPA: zinc-binding dehydrogenase [Acidobacteriota bacterium]|jgi:NADPH:quinone reductase-like Zn-dependent oxidoreductase|nr:zinc-binding dehydrogenase [Acidobacteriota bacterium]
MRAVRIHTHGGPEVLQLEQVEEPALRPGTAVVRVRACALNHLDLWVRRGIPGVRIALPRIPGSDIAGEVDSIDAGTPFSTGRRVIVSPGVSCGHCRQCLAGEDNLCRSYTLLGSGVDGGCAEKVQVPLANLIELEEGLSFEQAAAFPLVFLTAWHMLVTRAQIQPGEEVLILGANSGVGSAAVQIAKLFRCRVIATAGNEEKAAAAVALGADVVINHYQERISDEVRKVTGKRGVDIVFEHVGKATWNESLLSLARGGRLVTCGATSGYAAETDLRHVFSKQISILGSYMGGKAELLQAYSFLKKGLFAPVVDRVFALEEVRQAHQYLEEGKQFGKVVLRI